MIENDKFIKIKDYNYCININGEVYSLITNKKLKPFMRRDYYCVKLYSKLFKKTISIHRLVAKTFISNPENKPCVNHKDGNKLNNYFKNLEWCTYSENTIHAIKNNLKIIKTGSDHHRFGKSSTWVKKGIKNSLSKKVIQYDKSLNYIKTWDCIMDVQRELKIWNTCICFVCSGKRNTAGGFIWKYKK